MGRLFGTDGIRGIVNQDLTADLAMRVGASLGNILADNGSKCSQKVLVATDTRLSADMLCFAIASGLSLSGVDVVIIGVATTPAVAYLVKEAGFDAGVMITASHNPYEFNGIKVFGRNGYKLPDDTEDKIEALIKEPSLLLGNSKNLGRITFDRNIIDAYKEHLLRTFSSSGGTLRIAVDCANGSASTVAEDILKQVTSEVICINAFPNGTNINRKCGSTDLASLKAAVLDNGCDLGVAFDGDADRCLCVDENGEEVDGDEILAMCAVDMKSRGLLKNDTVVGTVMTNYGFGRFCNENGIVFLSTKVGDRYVLEEMLKGDFKLGGEQSGHVIFSDYATTGDGILTALQVMSLAERSGKRLSELKKVMHRYPQVLINVKVKGDAKNKLYLSEAVKLELDKAEQRLQGCGRILVRPSGTEPLVRVMAEGKSQALILELAERIALTVEKEFG